MKTDRKVTVISIEKKKKSDDQRGFSKGKDLLDKNSATKMATNKKHLAKGEKHFIAFIDLEKAYDCYHYQLGLGERLSQTSTVHFSAVRLCFSSI